MKAVSLALSMLSFYTTGVVLFRINDEARGLNGSAFNLAPLRGNAITTAPAITEPYRWRR